MAAVSGEGPVGAGSSAEPGRRLSVHPLKFARQHLIKSILKLALYAVVVFLILKLIPSLGSAVSSLEHASWGWVVAALALETCSEIGFVVAWGAIIDSDHITGAGRRGRRLSSRIAWAQLGSGMLVPGGSLASIGVGGWMVHRLGMPVERVAERQFNLSFLNTAVDAIVLILFGVLMGLGLISGSQNALLTWLPAGIAAAGLALALAIAGRRVAKQKELMNPNSRIGKGINALAQAVLDTRHLLTHREGSRAVAGALAYLLFDMFVLWGAFLAVRADPVPAFGVIALSYLIGNLGGEIPLPGSIGAIGGITAVLIAFHVNHDDAIATVVLYEAVALLVPALGGGIAYLLVRRTLASLAPENAKQPAVPADV